MKYIIGDKVKVREDLIVNKSYGERNFVRGMKPYIGKIMTISCVNDYAYYFKEDEGKWNWTDEMLEGVEGIKILVDGDKVIAERGDKVGIAKCSPEDEFDVFTGARIAISRLEEKCKPYGWLQMGMTYYYPMPTKTDLFDYYTYTNDDINKKYISRGLAFKTKEEAIECAKKMLEVVK